MFLRKKNNSPFYKVVIKENGTEKIISTGTSNYNEALLFMVKLMNGETPVKKKNVSILQVAAEKPQLKLSQFEDEYIKFISNNKTKSYIRSVKLSFKHFKAFTGDVPLNKIDVKLVDQFISFVSARSISGAGLYYRTLKAVFTKAEAWEYISFNPFKKIKTPKRPVSLPIFINQVELQEILNHLKNPLIHSITYTGFYTGMRLGELLNMKWSWINFNNKTIKVTNSESFISKGKRERTIPVNEKLLNLLLSIRPQIISIKNDDFVFPKSKYLKLNEDYVSKQFKKAIRASQLNDKIHFHTLRHSFASNLVQAGVSLYVVKELLGHADITTTSIYSHLTADNLTSAVALL
ncbi:MAG TPA: tyrosine-type recombinase/integrase [Ignavibacteriaceae bacterium]|nr:tyrosine-type recombinase/integrase [Ignavibacteriaceae bacterium]